VRGKAATRRRGKFWPWRHDSRRNKNAADPPDCDLRRAKSRSETGPEGADGLAAVIQNALRAGRDSGAAVRTTRICRLLTRIVFAGAASAELIGEVLRDSGKEASAGGYDRGDRGRSFPH